MTFLLTNAVNTRIIQERASSELREQDEELERKFEKLVIDFTGVSVVPSPQLVVCSWRESWRSHQRQLVTRAPDQASEGVQVFRRCRNQQKQEGNPCGLRVDGEKIYNQ